MRISDWSSDVCSSDLLFDGISTFRVDAGGVVVIERTITTYKTNTFGAADPSYLDVETLKTLTFLRFDLRNLIALRFPRHKLANDGTAFARGQAVVTPKVIRSRSDERRVGKACASTCSSRW